jgi:hypothetical protein
VLLSSAARTPQATTQRLSLSVLSLSDRITMQRVGSTQQLVLAGKSAGARAPSRGGRPRHLGSQDRGSRRPSGHPR